MWSDTWLDGLDLLNFDDFEEFWLGVSSTQILSSLSWFPNLQELYLNHDGGEDVYGTPISFPPALTTPLKHIRFEGDPNVYPSELEQFFQAPRAPETLTLQPNGYWDKFDKNIQAAFTGQNGYRSIVIYNIRGTSGHCFAYRCDSYQAKDINLRDTHPKHLCGNVNDFFTIAYIEKDTAGHGGFCLNEKWEEDEEVCLKAVVNSFPESLELLILGSGDESSWKAKSAGRIERCLIRLIQSDRCQGLQLIIIEATPNEQGLAHDSYGRDSPSLDTFGQDLVEVGKEAGIRVILRYNAKGVESPPLSLEWGLPRCPDAGDLESVSFAKRSPDLQWGIDPFSGRLRASRVLIECPNPRN